MIYHWQHQPSFVFVFAMNSDHYFPSASLALTYCRDLMSRGEADLFRGQSQDWPVIAPSLLRGDPGTRTRASKLLSEFSRWAENVPQMAAYHGSREAITAIAQHYGIPTLFLDLTTDPKIAELFARGVSDNKVPGNAVIYCFNSYKIKSLTSFSLMKIDVVNLWRLQAQRGLFLEYLDEAAIDQIRSMAIRVHFPREGLSSGERDKLYPIRKSALEITIDQWIYRNSINKLFEGLNFIENTISIRRYTYPGVFRWRKVPPFESEWLSHNPAWVFPPSENLEDVTDVPVYRVSPNDTLDPKIAFAELSAQFRPLIETYANSGKNVAFCIDIVGHERESASASLAGC